MTIQMKKGVSYNIVIKIYTNLNCSSSKKAKKWLDEHRIIYKEFNLNVYKLKEHDIDDMLKYTSNGFEDIISKRSNIYKKNKIDFINLNIKNLKQIIIKEPHILKRPIIIDNNKLQIGYNKEDIRIFMPKKMRNYFLKNDIYKDNQQYQNLLKNYFNNE